LLAGEGLSDTNSLVTHGSVIRAVMDYVAKALCSDGRIIIGDCPIQGAIWGEIIEITGLGPVVKYFREAFPGLEVAVKDYRLATANIAGGRVFERVVKENAIAQYYEVDLKERSLLIPLMDGKYEFGVSQYPRHRMRSAHTPTTNKYLFPKELMRANVI